MTPNYLTCDDLMVVRHGKTVGGFEYVCLENRVLIAEAVSQRRYRDMVREANWRIWG